MKELKPFAIDAVIGFMLILAGFILNAEYYSKLLAYMGGGILVSSLIHGGRILYYQKPDKKEEYLAKKQRAHINSVDERKQLLRAKAGQMAYQIMTPVLLFLSAALAFARVSPWIISMTFGLFLIQWGIGVIIYHVLEKRM